jgi:hypothetical protein
VNLQEKRVETMGHEPPLSRPGGKKEKKRNVRVHRNPSAPKRKPTRDVERPRLSIRVGRILDGDGDRIRRDFLDSGVDDDIDVLSLKLCLGVLGNLLGVGVEDVVSRLDDVDGHFLAEEFRVLRASKRS